MLEGHRGNGRSRARRDVGRVAGRASENIPEVASQKNLALLENRW
jgi:hypothetical protein